MWKINSDCAADSMLFFECSLCNLTMLFESDGILLEVRSGVFGGSALCELELDYTSLSPNGSVNRSTEYTVAANRATGRLIIGIGNARISCASYGGVLAVLARDENDVIIMRWGITISELLPLAA